MLICTTNRPRTAVWVLFEWHVFNRFSSTKCLVFSLKCNKKFGLLRFLMFLRSLLCSPRVLLFDQKCNKYSKIVKYYYDLK